MTTTIIVLTVVAINTAVRLLLLRVIVRLV
jgi:hypothetical protein